MKTAKTTMRRQTILCSAIVAVAVIAGCSTADDNPATTTSSMAPMAPMSGSAPSQMASHNDADIMFNQMMIPHHEQAIAMADLVNERTTTPAVRDLAERVKNAQQPEIDQMTARLSEWGVPKEATGGHGGHSMSGMMTDAEMVALRAARGTAFDRLWLEGMIGHHEGAIEMADDELARGIDSRSRELATQVKAAQQAEIDEMKRLLAQ